MRHAHCTISKEFSCGEFVKCGWGWSGVGWGGTRWLTIIFSICGQSCLRNGAKAGHGYYDVKSCVSFILLASTSMTLNNLERIFPEYIAQHRSTRDFSAVYADTGNSCTGTCTLVLNFFYLSLLLNALLSPTCTLSRRIFLWRTGVARGGGGWGV